MGIRSFLRLRITSPRGREFIRGALVALLVVTILLAGIRLRHWIAENTRHVRYQHDIVNGFYWGSEVVAEARRLSPDDASANSWTAFWRGYVGLYDRIKDEAYENDYGLDYPPLRLLAMSIWAKHVRNEFPGVDDGHPRLVNPLLKINLLCELLSVVAKRVDSRAARARRIHGNDGAHCFAVGLAQPAGLDVRCYCRRRHLLIASPL